MPSKKDKKKEAVKVPKEYEGSEAVVVKKKIRLQDVFNEIEGADCVDFEIDWKKGAKEIEVIGTFCSKYETFWVEGQPFRGVAGKSS